MQAGTMFKNILPYKAVYNIHNEELFHFTMY